MEMVNKTKDLFDGLVREGSFKWTLSRRDSAGSPSGDEADSSPTGRRRWVAGLSPMANVVVGNCSRILDVSVDELLNTFDKEASEVVKHPSNYARNFLEYCCFSALALAVQVTGHLADKSFRRLTFDMMLAWEVPSSGDSTFKVETESTVGLEAFSRIAPAIPTIADVITCSNLFDILASSTGGRLSFPVYDKYLAGLDRTIKKMKSQSESSLLSGLRSKRAEKILEVDGTLTTQAVLEHVGMSAWPGRLTLTDHALYFEALRVVTYDKPKIYDLADDLNQSVKPDMTGPWGSRLFDKAVMYKSASISEPVLMEFPELTGHSRRDYWLAIILEILYAHMFIRKFEISGVTKEEALLKAVLGILRLQSIQEFIPLMSNQYECLLMFNLCDKLPGGDVILDTLASTLSSRSSDRANRSRLASGMYSLSAFSVLSSLGVGPQVAPEGRLLVGEIIVGEMSSLEKSTREAKHNYKKVQQAQATVDGVKVDGLDTNLAVMKELLYPANQLWKGILSLVYWDDPLKSIFTCCMASYIILRGWIMYFIAIVLLFIAICMLLTRLGNRGKPISEVKVVTPPPLNTMEQLLAVQNAISQVEEYVKDGNVVLLKLRALLLAFPSQAIDRAIIALVVMAVCLALLPGRVILLLLFIEAFTMNSPPRRASTEKGMRRLREWWFSVPAAPVVLEREKEDKKKK